MQENQQPVSYRSTVYACYLGSVSMAVVATLLPILFIPMRELYGLSYAQLGALVLINFVTQVAVDIIFSFFVDKYGFRRFVVLSPVLAIFGFVLFAAAPELLKNPYPLFVAGTILYSGSSGLLELLLSPIVNAIPTKEKSKAMSVLHSFFCWGQVLVATVTTLAVQLFGKEAWQYIMLAWLILPLIDFFMFLKVPLAPPVPEEKRQSPKMIQGKGILVLFFVCIALGGAAELAMSQWASAFAEKALGVSKTIGDIAGMGMFAVAMGLVRMLYGKLGHKMNLQKLLIAGFSLAAVCYFVAVFSTNSMVALLACAFTGFGVALLWPGTLSAAAERYPFAGAWMFAILACAGDVGCSVAPWLVGKVADTVQLMPAMQGYALQVGISMEQLGLKAGLLLGAVFPLAGIVVSVVLYQKTKQKRALDKSAVA